MRFKTEALPPKVEAVFQAVISLLDQGYTSDNLKVSMIAKEAGIGKGTVYEYFESKEEIIARALVYEMDDTMDAIANVVSGTEGLEEALVKILEWLENNFDRKVTFRRLIRMQEGSDSISAKLHEELKKQGRSPCDLNYYVMKLVERGREKGEIAEMLPDSMAASAVFSGVLMFFVYLHFPGQYEKMDSEAARRFVVKSIMKTCGGI